MVRFCWAILVAVIISWPSVAFARPEAPPHMSEQFVPQAISEKDAQAYRDIFQLQTQGDWARADQKISELSDKVLMGYVLHQRYMHPTKYRSKYNELHKWMAAYADHPNAARIYRLALRRRPQRASPPVRPQPRQWRTKQDWTLHPKLQADSRNKGARRIRQIEGRVRYLCRKEKAISALAEITQHLKSGRITTRQYDRMRSWVAASLYYQGYLGKARDISNSVANRNGDVAALAHWIHGLIDFRSGRYPDALTHFDRMAASPHQDASLRAAAGFWAARAAIASGNIDKVTHNLEIAAHEPMTFYGQLALAQLGRDPGFDWHPPTITPSDYHKLTERHQAITRIVALSQIGRLADAELEMQWLNGAIEDVDAPALLAISTALRLPSAQIDIASTLDIPGREAGLFPIPDFAPADGFKADRAVLYGLMRQESKFRPDAKSRVGARGLMQLMPRTASFIAKDRSLASRKGRDRLFNPEKNLEIGQAYVNYLITHVGEESLFDVAAAYNGGPGNLRRWKNEVEIDDPLLFIESIPSFENRDFVEKVLTNIWVYRTRLGQPAPSRDLVAAGSLPAYEALDQLIHTE